MDKITRERVLSLIKDGMENNIDIETIKAGIHEEMFRELNDEVKQLKNLLATIGYQVTVAPDRMGFVIVPEKSMIRAAALGEDIASTFSFRIEFDMTADGRTHPEIAVDSVPIFMIEVMKMIARTFKDATATVMRLRAISAMSSE